MIEILTLAVLVVWVICDDYVYALTKYKSDQFLKFERILDSPMT